MVKKLFYTINNTSLMTLKVKAIEELLRFKNIIGFVVGRRLDGQQVQHGVEDVMLLEYGRQFTLRGILTA